MDSYIRNDNCGGAFSQVPHEYQVQTVDCTSSSSESDENSPIYPGPTLNDYYDSANSSVTSFEDTVYGGQFSRQNDMMLPYPDVPWSDPYSHSTMAPLNDPLPDVAYPIMDLTVHAPIPRDHRLSSQAYDVACQVQTYPTRQLTPLQRDVPKPDKKMQSQFPKQPSLLDDYPQLMFPTPSELLNHISVRDDNAATASTGIVGEDPDSDSKYQSQRKARLRALARSVGFTPTDPDTISSHEKKRNYLESIEQYIMFMHEQLVLVGAQPIALERVSTYRGLNSRSIRTLLVHMESSARKLHMQALAEEQVFLDLRDQAVTAQEAQEAAVAAQEFRRHSFAYM